MLCPHSGRHPHEEDSSDAGSDSRKIIPAIETQVNRTPCTKIKLCMVFSKKYALPSFGLMHSPGEGFPTSSSLLVPSKE
jgi:hypothetical protein